MDFHFTMFCYMIGVDTRIRFSFVPRPGKQGFRQVSLFCCWLLWVSDEPEI